MGSKIAEEGFKAEANFVAEEERKAQTKEALRLADERRTAKIEEQRVKQLEEQAEADRITQLKKDAEARSATRAEEAADPNFDIALWYAQLATDDTLEGRLASLRELDTQVFDPDGDGAFEGYGLPDAVGVTRGDYLEEELGRPEQAVNRDWAEDQALGMPFIEMAEKSGVSVVSNLSQPFEIDYPYEYDSQNLYMKLPPTGGTLDLTQGFSPEERKMYLDLEARGRFVDTSDGLAGAGEYTMMWLEDPPEQSRWHKFLNNPVVNVVASLFPYGSAYLTAIKAASGMTLHKSDYLSAGMSVASGTEFFKDFAASVGGKAGSVTGSTFVAEAVEQGTKNAISAVVTDQDPLQAFLTGGVQAGVGRILGKINEVTNGAIDKLEGSGQLTEDTRTYDANGKVNGGSAPRFVGTVAKELIVEAISSQLATGDINEARMAHIISAAAITADTVGDIVGERLPPGGIDILTRSLQTTLTTMALGGSGSEAFQRSMAFQLKTAVLESIREGTIVEDVAEIWDRAGGSYDVLYEQAANADAAANDRTEAAQQVNEAAELINNGADELSELANAATDILGGRYVGELKAEEVDAYDAAMKAYNTAEAAFAELLDSDYMPSLDAGNAAYEAATTAYDTAVGLYESTRDGMSEASQNLTEELAPFIKDINEYTVNSLNPDFDAKFYAEQNGITVEEANSHYLTEGLYNNLPVNQTSLDAQYVTSVNNALNKVAETTGVNLTQLSPKQMKDVVDSLVESADTAGVSIKDLDTASVAEKALSAANNPDEVGDEFFSYTRNSDGTATIEYGYDSGGFDRVAGVTDEDIDNGVAVALINPETGRYEWTLPYSETYTVDDNIIQYDPETEQRYVVNQNGEREDYSSLENDPSTSGSPTTPDSAPILQDIATPGHPAHNPESFTSFVNDSGIVDNLIKNDDGTFAPDPDADSGIAEWLLDALNNNAIFVEKASEAVGWEGGEENFTHPKNMYAILVDGLSQGVEAIGGIADNVSQEYGGAITQFAKDMKTIAEGSRTQEYNDAIERADKFAASLPPATDDPNTPIVYYEEDQYTRTNQGVFLTARKGDYKSGDESRGKEAFIHGMEKVLSTAYNDPNVFAGQMVLTEVPLEVANILIGSKVKLGSAAILEGISSVKGLGLTDDIVKSISTKFGLTAAAAMDVGESAGATFTGTYEQAYATQVKMLGLAADDLGLKGQAKQRYIESFYQETTDYALTLATNASFIAGLSTTAMLVAGGAELDKYFLDGKVPDEILPAWKKLLSGAEARLKAVGGEGLSEGGEELIVADYVNGELHLIDPSINISEENGVQTAFGATVGVAVAGTLVLGADASRLVSSLPPGTAAAMTTNEKATEVLVSMLNGDGAYSPQEAEDILYKELNGATTSIANVMDGVYDSAYTSTTEATSILDSSGLSYTYEDVTALIGGADGKYTSDADLDDTLTSYWAMTYGNENDTDGDGVPNNQDNEPNTPNKVAAEQAIAEAQEEADRIAQEEADRIAQEEADRIAQEEADRIAQEEADRIAQEEADRIAQEEADRIAAEAQIEADRLAAEALAAEEKEQAEADRIAKEAQAEADRLAAEAQAEADRIAKEEADRIAQEEADRIAQEEADRIAQEEADRIAQEEADGIAFDILNMAVGKTEPDLSYDFNGDGKITSRDALLFQRDPEAMKAQAELNREAIEEADRLAQEEADRIAAEAQIEADRLAAEALAAEEKEQAEADRIAKEAQAEADRLAAEAQAEADRIAQEEADRIAQEEADRIAQEEADRIAQEEADRIAQEEADRIAQEEADRIAQEEADRIAQEEADRIAQEEADRIAQEEADRIAQEEADRIAAEAQIEADRLAAEALAAEEKEQAEADRIAKEAQAEADRLAAEAQAEADRIAKEEADRIAQEEADRIAQEEADRIAQEEADRIAQEEADRIAQEEADRIAQEEADRIAQEEADRIAQEEADRIAQEEADRIAQEEADRIAQEEADRIAQEEADRIAQEEADRIAQEEADRIAQEEADRIAQEEADRIAEVQAEADRLAEEARIAQEEADRLAEEARVADIADREEAQEAARLAAEEAARLSEEAAVARDAIATEEREVLAENITAAKEAILEKVAENEEKGVERDQALSDAIDEVSTELGTTKEELLEQIGTTEAALAEDIASVTDAVGTAATDDEEATGLFKEIEDLVSQGDTLEEAIGKVATKIDTTEEALLAKLGTTEAALAEDIASVTDAVGTAATDDEEATGLFKEIEDLVSQGDTLEEAIGKVATKIDTTEEALLAKLGTTEAALAEDIASVTDAVGTAATDDEEATGLFKEIEDLVSQGDTLEEAIGKVATKIDTTEEALLAKLGTTEAALAEDIASVTDAVGTAATDDEEATGLFKEIEDLVSQGDTLEEAIGKVATKIDTTEEALLAKLGTTEAALAEDIASVTGAVGTAATDDEEATGLFKEIEDLVSQGDTLEEAIGKVATKIDTTEEALLAKLGTTEAALAEDIASVTDAVGTAATDDEEATGLFKEIEDLVSQGDTLEEAIGKVATKIDTTEEALLAKLGTTEAALAEDIASVTDAVGTAATDDEEATGLFKEIEDLVSQGDTLEEAIGKVATKIDTTEEALLAKLGTTEESLIDRFDTGINEVANLIGKPAKDVTEADIDFVTDVIAQQEVLSDPTSFVPTDQQLQYDVNNDGVIDINDQTMLEQAFGGQNVALSGQFGATGLYAYNDAIAAQQKLEAEQLAAKQKLEAEQQFEREQEIAQQQQIEIQTQIDQNQKFNMFDDEVRRLAAMEAAQPTVATTKNMGVAGIIPQYQFDTIFADKQQEQRYGTPFGGYGSNSSSLGRSPFDIKKASGGIIKDSTDRLLKIIGEN